MVITLFIKLEFGRGRGPLFVNPDHVVSVMDYHPYSEKDETPLPASVIHLRGETNGWIINGAAEDVIERLTPAVGPFGALWQNRLE
jgi:hypothetical protein